MNKSVIDIIQTEFIFLQYSIGHNCPIHHIKDSIINICNHIELLNKETPEYMFYKKYLYTFIFYIRDGYFNGKKRPRESYEILLTTFSFYPNEVIQLVELYIYYGSFKDINNLLLLTHFNPNYQSITSKCYDIYVKYLVIDYYKVFYFMEHQSSTVYISRCEKYIPKENKNIDKHTNATHEIAKRLFPTMYTHRPNTALKMFREIYQSIRKIINISDTERQSSNTLYEPLEFTSLHSDCVQTRSFADTYIQYHSKIKLPHVLSKNYLQSYRKYLLNYYTKTLSNSYIPLQNCYTAKTFDDDNIEYIKHYYYTNIHFFWNICETFIKHDYYGIIDKIIDIC